MKFIVAVLFSLIAFNSFAACELGDDKKCDDKAQCDSLGGIFKAESSKCFKQNQHDALKDCTVSDDSARGSSRPVEDAAA
jgi:hypothetical protein